MGKRDGRFRRSGVRPRFRLQLESLESRHLLAVAPLVVSEFMASNDTTLVDGDNNSSDWIEVYNPTDAPVELGDWYLTDDASQLEKWPFPDISLAPNEYLVVMASGQSIDDYVDPSGYWHTNFKLRADGEYLGLTNVDASGAVTVVHDYWPSFPAQQDDISFGLAMDNSLTTLVDEGASARYIVPAGGIPGWQDTSFDDTGWAAGGTGIGYENSPADYRDLIETPVPSGTASVYTRHSFDIADARELDSLTLHMRFDDGFIAYLNGTVVADRNAPSDPAWNSNASVGHADSEAVLFAPFDLTDHLGDLRDGNNVLAIHALNRPNSSDMLIEPKLTAGVSHLVEPYKQGILAVPSPGAVNTDAFLGFVADPTFSQDRGFYRDPIAVDVSTPTPGATLVYTLDGSEPTPTNGIQVPPPDANTRPQVTLPISATTVLRAAALKDEFVPSQVDTHTFVFLEDVMTSSVLDTSITQDPAYAPFLEQAFTEIPSLSLVFPGPVSGVEQETSVEWLSPEGGPEFQIDAGMATFGGEYTNFAKKNFRLYFRGQYGATQLEFPLFEGFDRGIPATQKFDQLNLRSGSHDMNQRGFYMSNRFTDDTMLDAGHIAPHGRFVHLYLNGVYWGQFHMRERWNADMLSDYLGGDSDDYESINGNLNVGGWSPGEAYDGDGSGWEHIKSLTGDYESIRQFIDVEQYIDYMLLYMSGNSENEYRTTGIPDGSTRYRFFLNDADGWLRSVGDRTSNDGPPDRQDGSQDGIFGGLVAEAHPDFMNLVADRIHAMFFHDGVLTPSKTTARLQERLDQIEHSFIVEAARWGYRTPDSWHDAADNALRSILPAMPQTMITRLTNRGLFPRIGAPEFSQQGGAVAAGYQLELSTDTVDPSDSLIVGKPVVQSSDGFGFSGVEAVNGDPTDFSHTGTGDLTPFLEVDLLNDVFLEQIVLHNRDSCCQHRLYNITVEIRDESDNAVYTSPVFNPVLDGQTPTDPGETLTLDLTDQPGDGVVGRKIRVSKVAVNGPNSSEWLSLGEIEVEGHYVDDPPDPVTAIYYTLDGVTDPRLPGGDLNPAAAVLEYIPESPISIATGTTVRARTLSNGQWSAINEADFTVAPLADATNLRITEIAYNPHDANLVPGMGEAAVDNDQFEFLELANIGAETIDLAGVMLQGNDSNLEDRLSFTFRPNSLAPQERVVVVRNLTAFESRYGTDRNVAGIYSGKLPNGGDQITVRASSSATIQQFEYNDSGDWPGRADGNGSTLEIRDTLGLYDSASNWRSSHEFGGSPGDLGTGPVFDVVVNEVLSRSNDGILDTIELHNATSAPIDLSYWHLSDDNDDYLRYTFSAGAVIGAGQYLTLDENEIGFALDGQLGDEIWLLQGDPANHGAPLRFADHQEFSATEDKTSLGRWPDGDASGTLFPMAFPTLGRTNSGPVFGDLLITEIHYHPDSVPIAQQGRIHQDELEFVELFNNRATPVDISHWTVTGIDFTFPAGTVLAASEAIVIVTFDPATEPDKASAFRNALNAASDVRLLGAAAGRLNNAGERVKLRKPEDATNLDSGNVLVDTVRYDDLSPWPVAADGSGVALARTARTDFAPTVSSWIAAAPSPGHVQFGNLVPGDYDRNGVVESIDYTMWTIWFGTQASPAGNNNLPAADGNLDRIVDAADFTIWRDHLGQTATGALHAISERTVSARSNVGTGRLPRIPSPLKGLPPSTIRTLAADGATSQPAPSPHAEPIPQAWHATTEEIGVRAPASSRWIDSAVDHALFSTDWTSDHDEPGKLHDRIGERLRSIRDAAFITWGSRR